MKHKVTIEDVAKYCHVSKSSVSRYLNHGYVSQEHKEKISRAINELGFERDYHASRLRARNSRMIGVIVNRNHQADQERILVGMQRHLQSLEYQGNVLFHDDSAEGEAQCLRQLLRQGADGVVLLDSRDPKRLQELVLTQHAKVLFARSVCDYAPYLAPDERMAGYLLGQYFKERQFHRFVYLQKQDSMSEKRRMGFLQAYAGMKCELVVHFIHGAADVYEMMKELISKGYEGVICDCVQWAMAAMKYCHEVHIHIPQNLSFACFGDEVLCQYSYPSLTTIVYPNEAFGVNLIEEIAAIHESRAPQWETMTMRLMEGESVGFVR